MKLEQKHIVINRTLGNRISFVSSENRFFEQMLQLRGIVGVPGCVFGDCGEGYLRLGALGHREEIEVAIGNFSSTLSIDNSAFCQKKELEETIKPFS